ncbi:hypothetical protein ILYODFUR_031875, partial [Ilyodon furcidens]
MFPLSCSVVVASESWRCYERNLKSNCDVCCVCYNPAFVCFKTFLSSLLHFCCFPPAAHLVLLTCTSLLPPPVSSCPCVDVPCMKEYVTVGQLNQIYGMPKVESSPTSPLRQPLQPGAVDPTFSCLPSRHGSSLSLSVEHQSEASRLQLPKLDLEQWYQELMVGSTQLCAPPLPAKSPSGRRPVLQVFRSKLDSDPGVPLHQSKSGSSSPLQHGAATLGRNTSSKSLLLAASSTGSLPRNLAATLQDIETKRQLALQQK